MLDFVGLKELTLLILIVSVVLGGLIVFELTCITGLLATIMENSKRTVDNQRALSGQMNDVYEFIRSKS